MRLLLAIRAFFSVLFGAPLPDELAAQRLGPSGSEALPPPASAEAAGAARELEAARAARASARAELEQAREAEAKARAEAEAARAAAGKAAQAPAGPSPEAVAVRAISVFQSEGRFFDFLSEDIDGYQDAEVGAAVREIHRGCRRALKDHFELVPVRSEAEESRISVPDGYDPAELRLVGNVVGKPPFSGTLKHKGWRVGTVRLPNVPEGTGAKVIVPAEVEV